MDFEFFPSRLLMSVAFMITIKDTCINLAIVWQDLCCHETYPYGAPDFLEPHFDIEFFLWLPWVINEPEAALSPQRQLTLLIEISRLSRQGAQFIIASHSPILLGIPDAQILSFDDGVIHECEYEDTDSYQVTEMFINNREYFLGRLLDE
jgi:hypothetical protein